MDRTSRHDNGNHLRYGIFIPLALMIASLAASYLSYTSARRTIADDLNNAMIALANDNCALWTRQDTIAALRQMHLTTRQPLIYQASELRFSHPVLKDNAYFTLAIVDRKTAMPEIRGHKIISDSIMIIPEKAGGEIAIRLQGFADCSMASVFAASDQTLPGTLLALSMLSMASMLVWRRKTALTADAPGAFPLDAVRLTPMQRQLTAILMDAPGRKVDKATLCSALWGNKSNAEESLYTLVRRTKTALADSGITIVCNRGDSYELRINS